MRNIWSKNVWKKSAMNWSHSLTLAFLWIWFLRCMRNTFTVHWNLIQADSNMSRYKSVCAIFLLYIIIWQLIMSITKETPDCCHYSWHWLHLFFLAFQFPFFFFSLLIQDNSSRGEHFYYAYESFHQQNKTSTIKKNCESTNIILAVVAYQFNMSGCLWEFFPYGNNNSTHKKRMIKQRLLKSFTNLNNSHE